MNADLLLMQDLCARLCHDLGGPVGTVAGALDLADSAGDEALEVARDAALSLRRRLRVWRAACGGGSGDLTVTLLGEMLDGVLGGGRVRLSTTAMAGGDVFPSALAQVVLTACLLSGEALPRGGVVHLSGDAEGELLLQPDGVHGAWPTALLAALDGTPEDGGGPRGVLPLFLLRLCAGLGFRLVLTPAAEGVLPGMRIQPA